MKCSIVKNFKGATALIEACRFRYKAHALEKLLCGLQGHSISAVEWGVGREVLRHLAYLLPAYAAPGSVPGRVGDCQHCLPVWRGSGTAWLSGNGSGGKGGHPLLASLTLHLLIRTAECLNGPFLV